MKIPFSIRTKLLMAAFGVMLIAGAVILAVNMTVVYQKFEARLQLRGVTIANLMQAEVVNQVLTEKFLVLELMLKDRLSDEQDIEYAFVTTKSGAVVAHTFEKGFPSELKNINPVPAGQAYALMNFSTEKDALIDIAIPLLKGELGQLHVGLSETSIRKQTKDIIHWIVWLIFAIMILAGFFFTILAHFITKPLLALAKTAAQASHNDLNVHFDVSSHDEIGHLADAFNNMIAARKQVESEREKLIAELQAALLEIKTLSGLLPICAWCKKIRDDKGYWKTVDIYMADHLDVEFTHGICPDCMKDVSKETFERLMDMKKSTAHPSPSQDNS